MSLRNARCNDKDTYKFIEGFNQITKCNLKTNKKLTHVRSVGSCHLKLFGHRTGHAHLFIIVPRLAGANVASEAKQTKKQTHHQKHKQQDCNVLGWFFWIWAHFLYFRWIFLHGGFGSPVTHQLLIQSFLTGNSCSLLLAILPTAAAGDNDGRVWIQMGRKGGGEIGRAPPTMHHTHTHTNMLAS